MTHPTSQWTIPQEMMNSIVQQVTKAVTEQLTPLPTQQSSTDSTQLREVPLVPTSQAATIPQTDTLVTIAVATAQSTLSGINSPQTDIPSTLFTSTSLPVDCQVYDKIKGKIWNNEYFDISLLLNNSIPGDKFQIPTFNQYISR